MQRETITVATVRRAHALEGELFVHLQTDYPEEVFREERVFQVSGGGPLGQPSALTLSRARPHAGGWILQFREIEDRTLAERYAGRHLSVGREDLVELGENEYFLHDLEGLEVRDTAGEPVGSVAGVYDTPGAPLLGVEHDGGESLVPLTGPIVEEVDLEAGVIRIRLPAGLLEI